MKKSVTLLTKETRKTATLGKWTFEPFTLGIKKLGQFFFCTYLLTCLKKDA